MYIAVKHPPSNTLHPSNNGAVKLLIGGSKQRSSPLTLHSVSALHHLTLKQEAHSGGDGGVGDQVCATSSSLRRTACEIGCTAQRDVCVINMTFY